LSKGKDVPGLLTEGLIPSFWDCRSSPS